MPFEGQPLPTTKEALIDHVFELQQTLAQLTEKVDAVRTENCQLQDENELRRHSLMMSEVGRAVLAL